MLRVVPLPVFSGFYCCLSWFGSRLPTNFWQRVQYNVVCREATNRLKSCYKALVASVQAFIVPLQGVLYSRSRLQLKGNRTVKGRLRKREIPQSAALLEDMRLLQTPPHTCCHFTTGHEKRSPFIAKNLLQKQ